MHPIPWTEPAITFALSFTAESMRKAAMDPHQMWLLQDLHDRKEISKMHPGYPIQNISEASISIIMATFPSIEGMRCMVLQGGPEYLFEECGVDMRESRAIFFWVQSNQ